MGDTILSTDFSFVWINIEQLAFQKTHIKREMNRIFEFLIELERKSLSFSHSDKSMNKK